MMTTPRNEIVFVDSHLTDYQTLLNGIPADAEVHIIDSSCDGLQQILSFLTGRTNIDAIHVLGHGSSGALKLGNLSLTSQNIAQYKTQLEQLGQRLTTDGDLFFYGCNVAQGEQGQAFIKQISDFTQADVAASDDLTGSAALSGDWKLEVQQGSVESYELSLNDYDGVLAYTNVNFTEPLVSQNGFLNPGVNGSIAVPGIAISIAGQNTQGVAPYYSTNVGVIDVDGVDSGTLLGLSFPAPSLLDEFYVQSSNSALDFDISNFDVYNSGVETTLTITGYAEGVVSTATTVLVTDTQTATANSWTTINLTNFTGISSLKIDFADDTSLYFNQFYMQKTVPPPTITSATYHASLNILVVTCTDLTASSAVNATKLTLTGSNGATYTLTTTGVTASTDTMFHIILNTADQINVEGLLNLNGANSVEATTYNLAAASGWHATGVADVTNPIIVGFVQTPTITSATYDANTGVFVVTGGNLVKISGENNDIIAIKLTITGEGGSSYTLTDSSNVEITDGTTFTLTLSASDKAAVNQLINKNGTSSNGGTTYNLAAADDWNSYITGDDIKDLTGNGITASNISTAITKTYTQQSSDTGIVLLDGIPVVGGSSFGAFSDSAASWIEFQNISASTGLTLKVKDNNGSWITVNTNTQWADNSPYDTVAAYAGALTGIGVDYAVEVDFSQLVVGSHTMTWEARTSTGNYNSNYTVTINVPPVFQSASTNTVGSKVILTYNSALSATTAAAEAFAVSVGGSANAVTTVTVNGSTVELTLTTAISSGQAVTVAYTDPTTGDDANAIQDAAGNDVFSFVTNVTNALPNAAPAISVPEDPQRVGVNAASNMNGFQIIYANEDDLDVTLTATNGTISGLTDVDPNTAGIQLRGKILEINTALADAQFVATNLGAAQVDISVGVQGSAPVTGIYTMTAEGFTHIQGDAVSYTHGATPILIDAGANAGYTSTLAANNYVYLVFGIDGGYQTGDKLFIRNQGTGATNITLADVDDVTHVFYGGVAIGTVGLLNDFPQTLAVTFTSEVTTEAVQALIRNVTFSTTSTAVGDRAVIFALMKSDYGVYSTTVQVQAPIVIPPASGGDDMSPPVVTPPVITPPQPEPVFEKPVSKDVESQVPSASGVKGDGNGDGISDVDQKNVISLPTQKDLRETIDTPKVFLSIALPTGQTLTKAVVAPIPVKESEKITFKTETIDSGGNKIVVDTPITKETAPFGLFEFNFANVPSTTDLHGNLKGGTTDVKLYLDDNQTVEKYLKQTVSGAWEPIPFAYVYDAKLGKTIVSISLTDGDKFDLDGKIDGGISDPGVPIITPKLTAAPVELPEPKEKVFVGYGSAFELTSGVAQVFGSSMREVLTLKSGVSNVIVDQNVEQVNLAGKFADYTFEQQGNALKIISNSSIVAKVPVQDDSNGTLLGFSDGLRAATFNNAAISVADKIVSADDIPLAILQKTGVYLAGVSVNPIHIGSDLANIYGSLAFDRIGTSASATNATVDANVEQVNFAGKFADYGFVPVGNSLNVMSGTTKIASIVIQDDTDGTILSFIDQPYSAHFVTSLATLQIEMTGISSIL